MTFRTAALTAFLLSAAPLLAPSLAAAGPVADAGAKAEMLQSEGKTVEALAALDGAVDALWTAAPLAFRTAAVVDSTGPFGSYKERAAGTAFKPDEQLKVYVQPVGYGYGMNGKTSRVGFKVDVSIRNATGQVVSEAADLFAVETDVSKNRRDFGMTLPLVVPYVRPGDYVASFTVRDQNSAKSGSFDIPFAVAAP